MKIFKGLIASIMLCLMAVVMVGCGGVNVNIAVGTYDVEDATFTPNTTTAGYTLERSGYSLVLKGTIPYSESVLGINAGNIVAIRFAPVGTITPDAQTAISTTNRQDESAEGWNTYGQEALEEDGTLVWVTAVSKLNNVQIKIKWNANYAEETYTLTVHSTATLATA
ncbi:MAG: hypothetical protein PHQ62_00810 [Clostridia bacterium]|nr:hypothetical protein [Clostridia bacterium]